MATKVAAGVGAGVGLALTGAVAGLALEAAENIGLGVVAGDPGLAADEMADGMRSPLCMLPLSDTLLGRRVTPDSHSGMLTTAASSFVGGKMSSWNKVD